MPRFRSPDSLTALLGPFEVGETPKQAVTLQAQQADGTPDSLTGAAVTGTLRRLGDAATTSRSGSLGTTTVTDDTIRWSFAPGDLDTPGWYELLIEADNVGANWKITHRFRMHVR